MNHTRYCSHQDARKKRNVEEYYCLDCKEKLSPSEVESLLRCRRIEKSRSSGGVLAQYINNRKYGYDVDD